MRGEVGHDCRGEAVLHCTERQLVKLGVNCACSSQKGLVLQVKQESTHMTSHGVKLSKA